tara:strand:- start:614 stop:1687 length:1074 start_codon:yes stop_codon:yes gene_type:complete
MADQQETCKNCEQQFDTDFNFCPYCGQKSKDDLTLGVLFYNTISNYFSFDARFFKSFFPLLFKPGYLAKKFVEGKRLLYLHPAQLYLFISVVFFFILSVTVVRKQVQDFDTTIKKTMDKSLISEENQAKAKKIIDSVETDSIFRVLEKSNIPGFDKAKAKELDSIIKTSSKQSSEGINFDFNEEKVDSLIAIGASDKQLYKAMGMDDDAGMLKRKFYGQMLKFYRQRNGGQILQAIYDTIPISLFVLLPIFALILKLLFFKRGTYAYHLVFSFYFFSFLFTVFSIVLLINQVIDIPSWIDWLIILSTFFYLLIAIKRFYNHGWFLSFFKTGVTTFIYLMFVIPIAIVIVGAVSFMFY